MEVILVLRDITTAEKEEILVLRDKGAKVYVLPGIRSEITDIAQLISERIIKKGVAELIELIKRFGDKNVNEEYISDLLTLDRIPIWHYQRFRIFFNLRTEWILYECISHFNIDGNRIIAFIPHNVFVRKNTTNITYKRSKRLPERTKINFCSLINYIIFFKLRILISLFRRVRLYDKEDIIVDRAIRQVCRNTKTLEKKTDNFILYPLFDYNPGGQLIISEIETPKVRSITPFRLHKYYFNGEGRKNRTIYGEWILFGGLISPRLFKKYRFLKSELTSVSRRLLSQMNTTTIFSDEEKRVLESFARLNKSTNFYIFKHLCYYKFFRKYNFRTISAIDENSPATRSILDAAKKCSIKTIGIQHGNIGEGQPAYLYTERDRERKIMTDITVTWGEYFTDFLIEKGNFPNDSVISAGQLRSDVIPQMLNKADHFKRELIKDSSIVLFASQPIQDQNYRYKAAYDVFSCFSRLAGHKLIVKLHPGEKFDTEYYKKIATEAGYNNPDIRYEVDLYEIIAVSDIVITCFSTVGSEAIYFGKPLIIYDPLKEDLLKYVQEGVAFQATDLESLRSIVHDLKKGTLTIDHDKYSQFIRKYAFAIDGKATERTFDIIKGHTK